MMLQLDKEAGGRGYKNIRRLRRDGNCFYRSFLFQLFEHYGLVLAGQKADPDGKYAVAYKKLIKTVEDSKKDMCDNAGYDEIVVEDFYDVFLEELKKLEG
jgi:ubiquitin thioesterase protein OTUB1